jgi:hypothetical protein
MVLRPKKSRISKKPEASGVVSDKGAKALSAVTGESDTVFGPSPNPATNLIIQDVALRAGGRLMRQTFEKGLLRGRYGGTGAKAIVENRSLAQTLVSGLIARYATRSLPGAVIIGGGLVVKTLYDRGRSKRDAKRAGDQTLKGMAED